MKKLIAIVSMSFGFFVVALARPASASTSSNDCVYNSSSAYDNGKSSATAIVVTSFYQNILHRAPDQAGLDYWTEQIVTCKMTVTQVLNAFYTCTEYCTNTVTADYETILGRSPDPDGLAYWVGVCVSGEKNTDQLSEAFYGSEEYRSKH